IRFSKSTNEGETWSDAITISDISGNCIDDDLTTEGAVPCIGPNGEIYVSWAGPEGIVFDKSTDGGATWGTDVFVNSMPGGWAFNVSGISRCNGMPITMCDLSGSPYNGHIFIVWSDQRNGATNTDIFMSKSTDAGETWSPQLKINDDNTARHQFFVWSDIDQSTGHIWCAFYDRRNTTGVDTDVFVAKSTDGGATFENFKVSESSFTPTSSIFFGDYTNIAAWNGKIYPIWMRLHNSQLSVWVAPLTDSTTITHSEIDKNIPSYYVLFQNYPNPFNPSTTISYQLPKAGFVTLNVFDVLGNEIQTLTNNFMQAGVHEVIFDASDFSSGMYFYRIKANEFEQMNKMILIK
ncbi:MAG: T9SS type A sorting domain-containing protein, partial [Ignavibacteria bacterium]|nr:T9SS type A sorting domain-containing protein [Ignavibacteria bacterium]